MTRLPLKVVLQTFIWACFIGIVVPWIASYCGPRLEVRWRDSKGQSRWIASSRGELRYGLTGEWKDGAGPSWYPASELTPALLTPPPPTLLNRWGFGLRYSANLRVAPGWRAGQPDSYALFRIIWIPYWVVVFPFWIVMMPGIARGLKRRFGGSGSGRCPQCGYDLRATPEAGGPLLDRCPECGAVRG